MNLNLSKSGSKYKNNKSSLRKNGAPEMVAFSFAPTFAFKFIFQFFSVLINTTIQRPRSDGSSSTVSFDAYGDRKTPLYELLNVREASDGTKYTKQVGVMVGSGDGGAGGSNITVNMKDIIWPGNTTVAPTGVFISNHLRVRRIYINIFHFFIRVILYILLY